MHRSRVWNVWEWNECAHGKLKMCNKTIISLHNCIILALLCWCYFFSPEHNPKSHFGEQLLNKQKLALKRIVKVVVFFFGETFYDFNHVRTLLTDFVNQWSFTIGAEPIRANELPGKKGWKTLLISLLGFLSRSSFYRFLRSSAWEDFFFVQRRFCAKAAADATAEVNQ